MNKGHIDDCKVLLKHMGIPYVEVNLQNLSGFHSDDFQEMAILDNFNRLIQSYMMPRLHSIGQKFPLSLVNILTGKLLKLTKHTSLYIIGRFSRKLNVPLIQGYVLNQTGESQILTFLDITFCLALVKFCDYFGDVSLYVIVNSQYSGWLYYTINFK